MYRACPLVKGEHSNVPVTDQTATHISRVKAASNICTAKSLSKLFCALQDSHACAGFTFVERVIMGKTTNETEQGSQGLAGAVRKETAKQRLRRINGEAKTRTKELNRLTVAYKKSVEDMKNKLSQLMQFSGNKHVHLVWHDTYNSGGGSNDLAVGGSRAETTSEDEIKLIKLALNLFFHHNSEVRKKAIEGLQVINSFISRSLHTEVRKWFMPRCMPGHKLQVCTQAWCGATEVMH